ncbi:MAG: polysaccharide biosynthesis/export protein [Kosmotoga sp.]|nr:polysaccharide biosynthesis/export protein [Kosmotoga sp.]
MLKKGSLFLLVALLVSFNLVFGGYLIREGDILSITVYGHEELSSEVVVGPDGFISVPPIGSVRVSGKILEEVEKVLSSRFRDILITKPQVTISIVKYAPYDYNVLGEVNRPGRVSLSQSSVTISELLASVGGPKETADLSKSFVIKKNGEKISIDLSELLSEGKNADFVLYPGDSLFIPSGISSWIKAVGEFKNPGVIKYYDGITLTEVIAQVGGVTDKADIENISVLNRIGNSVQRKEYNLTKIFSGKSADPILKPGATVIIEDSSGKAVRVLGEVRIPGTVPYKKGITLLEVIGETGGITQLAGDKVLIIGKDTKRQFSVELDKLLSGSSEDIELEPGDTVVISRSDEKYTYIVSPEMSERVDFSIYENLTLRNVLVKAGIYYPDRDITISILQPRDEKGLKVSMKDLQNKDYPLKPGTLVVLPLIRNTVYVLGGVKHPGPVVIESYEKATLNTVISKAGGLTENASEIQLIKDNKKTIFDLNESLESQTEIESGSIVYVEKLPERFVYLISPSVGGKVDFSREEKMSLRSLLSKYNLLDFESEEKLILLTGDGEKTEVKLTDLRNKDVPLSSGTVIIYPDTRVKIYILGEVRSPGVFAINPGDTHTLSAAISMAGGVLDTGDPRNIRVTYPNGESRIYNLKEILNGSEADPQLKSGATVYISRYVPVTVNVLGEVNRPGVVEFDPWETPTLLLAISKAGGLKETAAQEIKIAHDDQTYIWLSLIENQDVPLESGVTIYVPEDRGRYVYISGKVMKPGRVDFDKFEPFTLSRAIAKSGGLLESADNFVKIIEPDGKIKKFDIEETEKGKDLKLVAGSIIVVPEKIKRITIIGAVRDPGTYVFTRNERTTPADIIARAGGIPDLSKVREIRILSKDGKPVSYNEFVESAKELEDGSIVYVKPVDVLRFSVIGAVKSPGSFDYSSNEPPTLLTLISRAGGALDEADEIHIIYRSGKIESFDVSKLITQGSFTLEESADIVITKLAERYIGIIGDVQKPGLIDISLIGGEITLGKVLAYAGGVNNPSSAEIWLITDGESEKILLTPEKLSEVSGRVLEAGTIIYVPLSYLRVYVFGEVERPGVIEYTPDMNVLEAILSAGGPKNTAELSRVLLFKNGISENPEVQYVDLDKYAVDSKKSNEVPKIPEVPKVEPGDVIYVPSSYMVDIKEVMGVISSLLTIIYTGKLIAAP